MSPHDLITFQKVCSSCHKGELGLTIVAVSLFPGHHSLRIDRRHQIVGPTILQKNLPDAAFRNNREHCHDPCSLLDTRRSFRGFTPHSIRRLRL